MKNKFLENKLLYKVQVKKDAQAFAGLYDLYVEKIYRFVYLKVSHRAEAEDLTSETFLKVWEYLTSDQKKQVSSFSGLVYTVARHKVVDFYRKKSRIQETSLEHFDNLNLATEDRGMATAEISFEAEQLLLVIDKLKHEYQEIILLKYIEEFSTAEIAHILGKKQTAVRVNVHRALRVLKKMIDQEYER